MIEFKGTKNWKFKEKENGFYLSGYGWEDFAVIHKITDGSDPLEIWNDQAKANVKLILSAQEILEALQESIKMLYGTTEFEVLENYRKKVDDFEQIIKKAIE